MPKTPRYQTEDRETGLPIDIFDSLAEAEAEIKKYEEEDAKNGDHKPDLYAITEI
jgi:hypothetical protein